jgi:uncharacterized protein (DUF1800 family)
MATTHEQASLLLMQSTLCSDYTTINDVATYTGGITQWLDDQLDEPYDATDTFHNRVNNIWQDFKMQAIREANDDGNGSVVGTGNATLPYSFYWRMGWWQRTLSLANKNITADHPYNVLDKDNVSNQFKTSHDKERNSKNLVRHRVAQALSEIIVISDKSVLELDALGMADFYDIFYEHAFGNYTDILKKVSLHPCMGVYLTHLNNKKSNGNQHPDENYAREIMQLFTIGLNELNPDGSEKTDGDGNFIPTYDNDDIKELAKIFTGIKAASYQYEWPDQISGFVNGALIDLGDSNPKNQKTIPYINMTSPMVEESSLHDGGSATLFSGANQITIGAGNLATQVNEAVEKLVSHPNTAPFIAKKLIQQLVTSNPSSFYVSAVAAKFGSSGDLKAVIKEILTHSEATSTNAKKLKSPLLRVTQLLRAFNVNNSSKKLWFRGDIVDSELQHHILSSPTVFNFYLPNFAPHGTIEENNQVAPEFQLHNSATSIAYTNLMYDLLFGVGNKLDITVSTKIDNPNFFKTSDTTESEDKLAFDFTDEKTLFDTSGVGIDDLITRISLVLTGSETCSISDEIKNTLNTKIGYSNKDWVIQTVIFMIVIHPQFNIQMKRS